MAPRLITMLDNTRKRHAADIPRRQGILILPAHILHGVVLKGHALVRQDGGEEDAQDGLLHGEQAGQVDGAGHEGAEAGVAWLAGCRCGGGVEDAVYAGDDAVCYGRGLVGEALGGLAADEGEGRGAPLVDGFVSPG